MQTRLSPLLMLGALLAGCATGGSNAELGRRVEAARAALSSPQQPEAQRLAAISALGHDSRYYTLMRGWLTTTLQGVESQLATPSTAEGQVERGRERDFLLRALRAIDLE